MAAHRKNRLSGLSALAWLAGAGCLSGVLFNMAFGAAPWRLEGLAGGLVAGVLIFLMS